MTKKRPLSKTIYDFRNYKEAIEFLLLGNSDVKGQRTRLAEFIGCQPAYLSRVLNSDAHLSFEQCEAVGRFFVMNKAESHFLLALLGEERSSTQEMQMFWQEQRRDALRKKSELIERVHMKMSLSEEEGTIYFSHWYYAAIHAAVSIADLQSTQKLAIYLNLPPQTIIKSLDFLISARLVKKEGSRYIQDVAALHLDKNSPLVGRHHLNWKIKELESINHPQSTDVQYTSVITFAKEDFPKIKESLFKAIESIRGTVKASKDEVVACYTINLFDLNRKQDGDIL